MTTTTAPQTLLEAVTYFADQDVALNFVAALRWPDGPTCPKCQGKAATFLPTRRLWKCKAKECHKQFSVKQGTIFEDSPIPLSKWLPAIWMIANCKNGISSYELARGLKVTQKTAWFMLHRIRLAMQARSFNRLSGDVESDESFIGGRSSNMHSLRRAYKINARGPKDKAVVFGMLQRGANGSSQVIAKVVMDRRKDTLQAHIREHVEPGSALHTDALKSYEGLARDYMHSVIDHAREYVRGNVHTNGIENFWSLLKRSLKGTYVCVEPIHLFRYIDEQARRFNDRKLDDAGRFLSVANGIIGKRLTYKALTGAAVCPT